MLRRCLLALFAVLILGAPLSVGAQAPEGLAIAQLHLFLVPLGERLLVTEHYVLSNAGAEVLGAGLRYPLSPDAQNVQFREVDTLNERYRLVEGTVIDTLPVPPGDQVREVRFSYELPNWAGRTLTRTFPLPVEATVLMAQGEDLVLEGPALVTMGPLDTQEEQVNAYTVTRPLDAGEPLVLELRSRAAGVAREPGSSRALNVLLGVAALGMALWVSARLWRPGRSTRLPERARPLVLALAELDERFALGEIAEADYQQERARLKRALVDLLEVDLTDADEYAND